MGVYKVYVGVYKVYMGVSKVYIRFSNGAKLHCADLLSDESHIG